MVHYIRFLRTPQSDVSKKTIDISAVVAVTTDLGDAYYSQDVDLVAEVVEANRPHGTLHSQTLPWGAAARALKFTVNCPGKYISRRVRLHVTTRDTTSASKTYQVPQILDVWSCAFHLSDKQRTEPLVERRLLLPNRSCVRMWEETGDSIARHIWYVLRACGLTTLTTDRRDASLGFLMYFSQAMSPSPGEGVSRVATLLSLSKVRRLRVLELGAGCGIVGVACSQLVKCDMILTDLEDAQEILARNIQCASPSAGSTLQSRILDWASGPDDSSNANFDLILVSDCIYNPDSSLHLVETLRQLATRAPHGLILVGFKRRHEADTIFFDRMQQTHFEMLETIDIPLPHTVTDHDSDIPTAEFYTYRFQSGA